MRSRLCLFVLFLISLLNQGRNSHASISSRQNGAVEELHSLIDNLINNAWPLEEVSDIQKRYQQGYSQGHARKLGDGNGEEDEDSSSSSSEEETSKNLLDFSSYSFRYATCQPVQRFSERSVKRGEYSSLVRDDLVIFRFCPKNRCSSTQDFGCSNGYGEYVASMYEYLSTMIQYKKTREQNYCEYCFTCENYRRRDLAYYTDEASVNDDDQQQEADDQTSSTSTYDCSSFSDKCENYSNVCSGGDTSDLSEYVACKEVSYGNKAFWISPYCDDGTIIMGVFYDPYCSQYAGNSVKISEVTGKSFSKSLFSQFYSSDCVSCASDSTGPFGSSGSIMCNQLYSDSAKCNANMATTVDTTVHYFDQSVCNFAESIHYGSFDSNGLYASASSRLGARHVTNMQLFLVVVACISCAFLSVYSCYIHHEITNLLLKQLSARGKLVPGSSAARSRVGYYSKSSGFSTEDDDSRVLA